LNDAMTGDNGTEAAQAFSPAFDRMLALGALAICVAYTVLVIFISSPVSFYTLDDAYIHMALAENIARGHFGVNLGEVSNPSSSILWPWLMAGFEKIGLLLWAPLIVNVASFIVALRVLLAFSVSRLVADGRDPIAALLFAGLGFLSFNLFGVIFTGMEHSLHVLVSVVAITRVIDRKYDWLTVLCVVLCPLLRFEGVLAVAFAVCMAMWDRRWMAAGAMVVATAAALGVYELYLSSLGLPPLPSSVLTKSAVASSAIDTGGPNLWGLLEQAGENLHSNMAHVFGLFAVLFAWAAWKRDGRERLLALGMLALTVLIFMFGRMDSYARYQVWILCVAGVGAIHLMCVEAAALLKSRVRALMLGAALLLLSAGFGLGTVLTTPMAARNIDRQQYQMHRLVTECWKKPVAINDLGWVSFRNDRYVLDLAGLGSEVARKARASSGVEWMDDLARQTNTEAAMIYPEAFPDVPASWIHVGDLLLKDPRITPFSSTVAFYATRPETAAPLEECLVALAIRLPPGAAVRVRPG
jgi:hypothetical protein